MAVAISTHLVANAVQRQHPVLERLKRRQAFLQGELGTLFIRPEVFLYNSVRTENDYQTLFTSGLVCKPETRQIQNKRQCGGTESKISEEFSTGGV